MYAPVQQTAPSRHGQNVFSKELLHKRPSPSGGTVLLSSACRKSLFAPHGAGIHRRPSRFPCALRPEIGAFLETGSLSPPLAAHRPFPLLGFPAHTLYPQGVCSIRKAAKPLTAALPYRRGEFTALSTVSTAPKGPFFFARLRRNGSTSTPVCMIFCHMFIYQKTGTSRFLPGLDNSRKSIIISNYSKLYY